MNNQTINEIKKRDLDKVWFSMTILSQDIFYNFGNDYIKKRTVNVIFACTINGTRRYITSIFDDQFTKTSDWYNLFLSFKNKGLDTIFFAVIPNNKIIKNALDLTFKNVNCIFSCFNIINKIYHYISYSYSNDFLNFLKDIYLSVDQKEFYSKFNELVTLYDTSPFIVDILNQELNIISNSLIYPVFLRKHIIPFYFIREFVKKLNSSSHCYNYFNSIEDFECLLLPFIQSFEKKMYCGKDEWNSIISYLYEEHKELLLCVL